MNKQFNLSVQVGVYEDKYSEDAFEDTYQFSWSSTPKQRVIWKIEFQDGIDVWFYHNSKKSPTCQLNVFPGSIDRHVKKVFAIVLK